MVAVEYPRAGPVEMVSVPVRLSETPGSIRRPSPSLGEHSGEVLREVLGLSAQEVADLI